MMFRTLSIAAVIALMLTLLPASVLGQAGLLNIIQQEVEAREQGQQPIEAATDDTAAAPATQPTTQATTQPAVAQVDGVELSEIDLIKVIKGEKALAAEQILQLGYWLEFAKDFIFAIMNFIPRLFAAVFLFGVFWVIYRCVRRVLVGAMTRAGVDQSIRDMLSSLLKWSILGFGLVIAGNQIGIQIAALLTGVSIVGLAIGFAAQETLANFIAGIVIFWDKPFKVGDWIEIDGTLGQVKRVTFRSTRLHDMDNDVVIYPNTAMLATKVVNKSTNEVTRCRVNIGIAYKESIERAREVLLALVRNDPRVEKDPEPEVVVNECGASSVDLGLWFWIREEKYEDAMMHEFLEKSKVALDAAGIEIPFPHMQLLVEQTPAVEAIGRAISSSSVSSARLSA